MFFNLSPENETSLISDRLKSNAKYVSTSIDQSENVISWHLIGQ